MTNSSLGRPDIIVERSQLGNSSKLASWLKRRYEARMTTAHVAGSWIYNDSTQFCQSNRAMVAIICARVGFS
jgi:hypothetical protein